MALRELATSRSRRQNEEKLQGKLKGFEDGKEEIAQIKMMKKEEYPNGFQMPLHYPSYRKSDYEKMEERKLDLLLKEYGLGFQGNLDQKRPFAMGTFFWCDQLR
ncbi:Cytoplasmic tRNA 2-thiolation protein 1 [Melia azedarach]|uniref:Cytoplasmic tRNA 2-thiolation protein 1 n=1 Tax=Melia azedarach TaxID=155640 RepID=A0ACC1YNJ5_MELAZ|nr:Cytoplasmic tRNA 2-thiolation protein 1 [Melia azedarach]